MNLDAIDRKILKFLIKNARMPFLEIARECGISGAAIHQRIRKLDESGVILGSRLIVDPKTLGFDVCAYIGIRLQDPQYLDATVEKLKQIPEIVECHFITGTYNVFVKLYCLDNEHLNSPEKTTKEGRFHRNCPSFHSICIYLRARISRATNTPLADAWDSECVMPLPSPMTYSPSCGVSRWSFSATSML